MNYQQVNDAVDEINKVIKAKYKILNLPRSAMGEPIMKKYKVHSNIKLYRASVVFSPLHP